MVRYIGELSLDGQRFGGVGSVQDLGLHIGSPINPFGIRVLEAGVTLERKLQALLK